VNTVKNVKAITDEPRRRMDIRDECVCGHQARQHAGYNGACKDFLCRCRGFYLDKD